jgi:hypothetical protein
MGHIPALLAVPLALALLTSLTLCFAGVDIKLNLALFYATLTPRWARRPNRFNQVEQHFTLELRTVRVDAVEALKNMQKRFL